MSAAVLIFLPGANSASRNSSPGFIRNKPNTMNRLSNRLFDAVKILIGLGLLYFLYTRLEDPQALWQQILNSNKLLLLIACGFYAGAVFVSGVKWFVLLRARGVTVPFRAVVAYQWVGEFFNYALPTGVGGDLLRGYGLARDTHRRADAAVSVIIDRFVGLTTFVVAAAVASGVILRFGSQADGSPFTPENQNYLNLLSVAASLVAVGLLTILAVMLSRRMKRFFEGILARLPLADRTLPLYRTLADAFNAYHDQYWAIGLSALGSLGILVLSSVAIWFLGEAIEPGSIKFLSIFAMNPIVAFVLLVPLAPGGAGLRQGAFVVLLGLVGVAEGLAFAVGLLQHAMGLLVSLPGVYLWAVGRRRIQAQADEAAQAAVQLKKSGPSS